MAYQNGKSRAVEVQPRATRRTFSAEYKRRILAEADACRRGQVGALLRREGLYYSHLTKWRGEREAGTLVDRPRGPTSQPGLEADGSVGAGERGTEAEAGTGGGDH